MRLIGLLGLSVIFNSMDVCSVAAQTPTNCLEIESILIDACGTPEGENEMVRFTTGPSPISISNLSISWPNNSFLGISPINATTASVVNALNSTITSCGHLIEPTGGIIPSGKTVLLITSTNVSVSANSFANLSDTLYVIFQNAGNTAGHFANYSTTPGIRTLSIGTISPSCSDVVSYDKSLLTNQAGGHGGTSAQNDGATVEFSWNGTANYINNACQAPIQTNTVNAGPNTSACAGTTVNLTGSATGNYSALIWQGGQGTFSSPNTLSTSYTIAANEFGSVTLMLGVVGTCNDTVFSTMVIAINQAPNISISSSGPTTICAGASVTLTASGGTNYSWSTGATGNSVTVNAAGTYSVSSTNSCGTQTATQTISVVSAPTVAIQSSATSFCTGNTLLLYATGSGNYSWTGGSTNDSIYISAAGTFSVSSTTSCGTASDNITVTQLPLPVAAISSSGGTSLCPGSSTILSASGGTNYVWNPSSSTSNTITVTNPGTYAVTASNTCGSSSASITINSISAPVASITPSGNTIICQGENLTLTASGGSNYLWSNGQSTNTINASEEGIYWVAASNSCGNDTAFIFVNVDSVNAFFTASALTGTYPLSVDFFNSSSPSAISFSWNSGNGLSSNQSSFSTVYSEAGLYNVTLSATNAMGCSDTYQLTITVEEQESYLQMPNVFTPNHDGVNDDFSASGSGIEQFNCMIFNRWGILIAELKSFNSKWDGRNTSGNMCSDGTYFFTVKARGKDNQDYDFQGFTQLINK